MRPPISTTDPPEIHRCSRDRVHAPTNALNSADDCSCLAEIRRRPSRAAPHEPLPGYRSGAQHKRSLSGPSHSDRGPRGGNGHTPSTTTNMAFWLVAARSHVVRDPPGAHLILRFCWWQRSHASADSDNMGTRRRSRRSASRFRAQVRAGVALDPGSRPGDSQQRPSAAARRGSRSPQLDRDVLRSGLPQAEQISFSVFEVGECAHAGNRSPRRDGAATTRLDLLERVVDRVDVHGDHR